MLEAIQRGPYVSMGSILKLVDIAVAHAVMVGIILVMDMAIITQDMVTDTITQVIIPDQDLLRSEARRHMTLYAMVTLCPVVLRMMVKSCIELSISDMAIVPVYTIAA